MRGRQLVSIRLPSTRRRSQQDTPADLDFTDLDAPTIAAFLTYLETERNNSIRSRNARGRSSGSGGIAADGPAGRQSTPGLRSDATVRMPAELDRRLEVHAEATHTRPSEVLRRALDEYLNRHASATRPQ